MSIVDFDININSTTNEKYHILLIHLIHDDGSYDGGYYQPTLKRMAYVFVFFNYADLFHDILFFCVIFYNIFSDAYERVERQDDANKQRKNQKHKEQKT
jgi:hypothetical protein